MLIFQQEQLLIPTNGRKNGSRGRDALDMIAADSIMPLKLSCYVLFPLALALPLGMLHAADRLKIANGFLEGTGPQASGVREFKGIPFAAPPVGDLRWAPPQPAKNWNGVRQANQFGPRCMQQALFGDMGFRSNGMSEDCLYLNVWTPAKAPQEKLPVMVYFFGGGFQAGDGSEPRYDGESMAGKGIVAVTVNYRLGVFGFLAHPDLTKNSPHHASGNYALLDQNAALQWVKKNIAAFGGDPARVTIAGESAGSIAVSAQMASPLSKDLIAGAIGESGSLLATLAPVPLAKAEESGVNFATAAGATSLAALRAMTTAQISKQRRNLGHHVSESQSMDIFWWNRRSPPFRRAGKHMCRC